jgi:hypothetical protein
MTSHNKFMPGQSVGKFDEQNSSSSKTTVKPTVVRPLEDKLIVMIGKPIIQSPDETGTDIRENILCKRHLELVGELTLEELQAALEQGHRDYEAAISFRPMLPGRFV